jgi:hypothetical protein
LQGRVERQSAPAADRVARRFRVHRHAEGVLRGEAKLRIPNACIEDIDYTPKRELDRALLRQLGTCAWIGSPRT